MPASEFQPSSRPVVTCVREFQPSSRAIEGVMPIGPVAKQVAGLGHRLPSPFLGVGTIGGAAAEGGLRSRDESLLIIHRSPAESARYLIRKLGCNLNIPFSFLALQLGRSGIAHDAPRFLVQLAASMVCTIALMSMRMVAASVLTMSASPSGSGQLDIDSKTVGLAFPISLMHPLRLRSPQILTQKGGCVFPCFTHIGTSCPIYCSALAHPFGRRQTKFITRRKIISGLATTIRSERRKNSRNACSMSVSPLFCIS